MRWSKPFRRSLGRLALVVLVALFAAPPLAEAAAQTSGKSAAASGALLRSRQLWATIDVCNPFDQPDMIGVRGSMPGDGAPHDAMYMRFRLEYLLTATKRWMPLATGVEPAYVPVGTARSARQAGRSFQLVPVPGKPAFELRGVVSFQWRRGASVVLSTSRPTSAGRQSLAGADPPGYSAASCLIG
jgi:hypothetical protein